MAIWLTQLAVDRWRHGNYCALDDGMGEGADAAPVALITETAHGPRIDAANDAGRAAGAAKGMMLADARTLCPQLQAVPSDPAGDLAFLERMALWARRWGPWSALDPPDGLLVDITAVAHLFGGEKRLLADVSARLAGWGGGQGLAVRTAIAPTAGAAWALAHYGPNGTILALDSPRFGEGDPPRGSGGGSAMGAVQGPSRRTFDCAPSALRSVSPQDERDHSLSAHPEERLKNPRQRASRSRVSKDLIPPPYTSHGSSTCSKEDLLARLANLPVAALRLDDDVLLVLKRLGLKRLGELSGIEGKPGGRDAIHRRFRNRRSPAANPLVRLDQLLGRVPEPLLPVVAVAAPLVQRRLMEPIRHRALLDQVLRDLAADMARELEGRGEGARRLELGLWRVDGEVVVRRLEMAAATRDPAHVCRLFADRLDDVDAGFGIEMVRLRAAWAEPLDLAQTDLEAAAQEHGTSLAACIDRLTVRLGEKAVRCPVPHDSHLPERAQRWQAPLNGGVLEHAAAAQEEFAFHPRPLKMLDRPEKIAVLYATPDGYLRRFRWRGEVHEVARAEGPERIAPEWWREKGSARLRDYYRIEDERGRRYWIYRAGLVGDGRGGLPDWFLQGLCA